MKNHNFLEEYPVKIYEIVPYFYEHYEKKKQIDENGRKYMLFRIDVYFSECFLAIKIDEQDILAETLFLKKKDKKHWL